MQFHFNKEYNPVFTTAATEIDLTGGRARGGSHFATDYFLYLITTSKYFRGFFMRFVKADVKNSLYQDFKDRIEEKEESEDRNYMNLFHFNDNEMSITYLPNGNKIKTSGFRKSSNSRTAISKSIAGATHIIIEEFDEVEEWDYMKLKDSLRTTKVKQLQIIRIWNPPVKSHWVLNKYYTLEPHPVYKDYFIYKPKNLPRHKSIFSTFHHNIKNVNQDKIDEWNDYELICDKYKRGEKLTSLEERYFNYYLTDILGLVSAGAKGQIFKNWKLFKELPEDAYFYTVYGLDWGGNDPHAIIKLDFDKKQRRVYMTEILYQPEILNSDLIKLIKQVNPQNHEVVCDSARKDKRFELSDAGINVIKADKTKINDDFRKDVIDMAKEYETFVHEDSENLITELQEFKWAMDASTKEPLDKPEDKNNHLQDARFYATRYYHVNYGFTYNKLNDV